VQYVNPFPESVNLPSGSVLGQFHPVPEEDSGPPRETTAKSPQQSPSTGRRATPHHAEVRDGHCAQGVGSQERRDKARLLHQHSKTPHPGGRGDSLNRAARREVPAVAGTARTQSRGRGSPQSKPDKQDSREAGHDQTQGQLQQWAVTPPELVHYSRAEPVWTGDLTELRHLQENSPGVVAEVYRAQREGRRPVTKKGAKSRSHVVRPRCSFFPYADTATSRRA